MVGNPTGQHWQDRSRINVNKAHELRYWAEAMRVEPVTLRAAVEEVGPGALAVRAYLWTNSEPDDLQIRPGEKEGASRSSSA